MKTWKGYNFVDFILIFSGIVVVTVSSILFGSKWYITINTILGLLCVFTQAKGKVSTQFIGIVYFFFYIFISYSNEYYGESLLYLIIMLPLYIYGAIHWLANRDKKDNVVIVKSNLSKTEWIVSGISFLIVSLIVFIILKVLNTAQLLISTLSFVSMLPAVYLLIRRCKWNQVAFLLNDFIVPILWILLVIQGNFSFLPMCIYYLFQVTYDIYGLLEWIKLEKEQKSTTQKTLP